MKLLLLLTVAAEATADTFQRDVRTNLIEELFWALIGVAGAILTVRTAMRLRRQLPGADPVNSATLPFPDPEAVLMLKLAQWRSSAMILITATALGMLLRWFSLLDPTNVFHVTNSADLTFEMAASLDFYSYIFAPVLAWHLADLIERPRAKFRLIAAFTSHALMTGVLIALSFGWLISLTGWVTDVRPCGGTFLLLMEDCWYINPAISVPSELLSLALLPLTLVKLAVSLWSRLGPRT